MRVSEIITKELIERYRYKHRPAPKMAPTNQTTGLNPKIDLTKGNNFQLNNRNIRPELTDREIEMAMQSRNKDNTSF